MTQKTRQKILIVEDESINLDLLSSILRDDYQLILEKSGSKALARAEKQQPDLILLDIVLPDLDGFSVITALKNNDRTKEIPVIFISSLKEVSDEEMGLMLGAVDYITKPYNAAIVKARVKTQMKLVTQVKLLERIALLDGLTEIPNRRSFTERFLQEWERAVRNHSALSLVMIDVDFFKQYNDNYGHGMGDEALKTIAHTLSARVQRSDDFLARIGGEEFAIILPDTDAIGGISFAEKLRAAIEMLKIPHDYSVIHPNLTISLGGATVMPVNDSSHLFLYEEADRMLYQAKEKGRNRVCWL